MTWNGSGTRFPLSPFFPFSFSSWIDSASRACPSFWFSIKIDFFDKNAKKEVLAMASVD